MIAARGDVGRHESQLARHEAGQAATFELLLDMDETWEGQTDADGGTIDLPS